MEEFHDMINRNRIRNPTHRGEKAFTQLDVDKVSWENMKYFNLLI